MATEIVDVAGNINTVLLEKELQDALASDTKYKQVDNMKKRAVKTASDYSEFKAMVACAHLKKISSKEVASLSDAKKGWKHASAVDNSGSAQLLVTVKGAQHTFASSSVSDKTIKYPKTCMELERELRRIESHSKKILFLKNWGIKRAKAVLAHTADADLMEELMRILTVERGHDDDLERDDHSMWAAEWLVALSSFDKFIFTIQFASRELKTSAASHLEKLCESLSSNSFYFGDITLEDAILRYRS